MKWSFERPKEEGWYWCKLPTWIHPYVYWVEQDSDDGTWLVYEDMEIGNIISAYNSAKWAGPIPKPEE